MTILTVPERLFLTPHPRASYNSWCSRVPFGVSSTAKGCIMGLPTKKQLLSRPIEHIDITRHDPTPLVHAMRAMAFTARDLARAADIYDRMLRDADCGIILTLAGSLISAGLRKVFADLVRHGMVDAIVSTGANLVDQDFFEALGFRHYLADDRYRAGLDDALLRDLHIDRIYDTFIDEDELRLCDEATRKIADSLEPRPYSSRQFLAAMGAYLTKKACDKSVVVTSRDRKGAVHARAAESFPLPHGRGSSECASRTLSNPGTSGATDSIVRLAYEHQVPIFCPAFSDCSAGFGLVAHQHARTAAGQPMVSLDSARDFYELTQLKIKNPTTGILMIGGGVPKNFTQDIVVAAEVLGSDVPMHKYAVQVTVADVRDGALSSSTLKEASSWGKVDTAYEQMVYSEATLAVPLLAGYAYHQGAWRTRPARHFAALYDPVPQPA
jgi:deoxyhypusine synthase